MMITSVVVLFEPESGFFISVATSEIITLSPWVFKKYCMCVRVFVGKKTSGSFHMHFSSLYQICCATFHAGNERRVNSAFKAAFWDGIKQNKQELSGTLLLRTQQIIYAGLGIILLRTDTPADHFGSLFLLECQPL
jgi:hypothetical protein